MQNVNERIMELYNDGVLLEDIQKLLNLPVKTIVDIIFEAKSVKDDIDKRFLSKKSNCYICFCEYIFEDKSIKDIMLDRSITQESVLKIFENVLKSDHTHDEIKEYMVNKLAKEFGVSKANAAMMIGLTWKQSFKTTLKRIWR